VRPRTLASDIQSFAAKTPTLPPATHTNSYALGKSEVMLVEPATPYEGEQRAWIEWARSLESQGRKPIAIVLTHHHDDHVGGVEVLAKELGLPVWAHAKTRDRIERADIVTRIIEDGESLIEGWTALHTPGHAPGHICLWHARSKTLVVGDMVASVGTILIAPGDGDMAVYLEQLERLRALGATLALPAHGDPIDAPDAVFTHYVKHRLMREAKVLGAVRTHPGTLEQIVPHAYDDTPPAIWPIARLSLAAHIEKLERDGRVERDGARWRVRS
jgi:glyoxylase-like metal-dependent hydrolase (beta-lactamase superfamily II)